MYSFARIFKRLEGLSRLGRCVSESNSGNRNISILGASNKLHKNGNDIVSNIGQASINRGYYKPPSHLIKGSILTWDSGEVTIETPDDWPSVPIVPIRSCALVPSDYMTDFKVTDRSLINVINKKIAENEPYIGMFLVKDEKNESKVVKNIDDIHPIGTFTRIYQSKDHGDFMYIGVVGDRRISIKNLRNFDKEGDDLRLNYKGGVLFADVQNVTHEEFHYTDEMKELAAEVEKAIRDIAKLDNKHGIHMITDLWVCKKYYNNPIVFSDIGALYTSDSAKAIELQKVLEERNIHKRLELSLALLKNDFEWRSKSPENRATSFLHHMPINY